MFGILVATAAGAAEGVSVEVETSRRLSRGVVVGVVDAPAEQVLDLVMDCAGTSAWFPDVDDTRVVPQADDGVVRCAGRTDLPWPLTDRTWQIDTAAAPGDDGTWVASFAYVAGSGNLLTLRGRYVLEPRGDRTAVRYEASVDLGFWVPAPVVDWATRSILPGILEGIELATADRALVTVR